MASWLQVVRWRIGDAVRWARELAEDQWFDRTRRVRTAGNVTLRRAGIGAEAEADSELYQPARPRHIRAALRDALRAVPVTDAARYAFVDLGSGKGRTLFVAAEWPFAEVVGVEFSAMLHATAVANAKSFRWRGRRAGPVTPLHANAMEYRFPDGPFVLYLFNPFGAATMEVVLRNLQASLTARPRQVAVVLLWPRCGEMVAAVPGMRRVARGGFYEVFACGAG